MNQSSCPILFGAGLTGAGLTCGGLTGAGLIGRWLTPSPTNLARDAVLFWTDIFLIFSPYSSLQRLQSNFCSTIRRNSRTTCPSSLVSVCQSISEGTFNVVVEFLELGHRWLKNLCLNSLCGRFNKIVLNRLCTCVQSTWLSHCFKSLCGVEFTLMPSALSIRYFKTTFLTMWTIEPAQSTAEAVPPHKTDEKEKQFLLRVVEISIYQMRSTPMRPAPVRSVPVRRAPVRPIPVRP